MIHVKTPAGKKALAASLAVHAPNVLADITMLSRCIGGTSEVYVELTDAEAMTALTEDMAAARAAHVEKVKAQRDVAACKTSPAQRQGQLPSQAR